MRYLTFADFREKLGGRARSTIYLDVEAERLPAPIKLGGRLYWRDDEVDEWLRRATVDAKNRDEDRTAASRAGKQHGRDHRRAEATDELRRAPDTSRRRIGKQPSLTANTGSRRAHRLSAAAIPHQLSALPRAAAAQDLCLYLLGPGGRLLRQAGDPPRPAGERRPAFRARRHWPDPGPGSRAGGPGVSRRLGRDRNRHASDREKIPAQGSFDLNRLKGAASERNLVVHAARSCRYGWRVLSEETGCKSAGRIYSVFG